MINRPLTAREQAFVDLILKGKNGSSAYREAGYAQGKPEVIAVKAHELAKRPVVAVAIAAGKQRLADAKLITREELIGAMTKIVLRKGKDAKATARDVVAATAQASRMLGCDAPQKIEVKLEGSLLHQIRNG